jgi:hypothetical protein
VHLPTTRALRLLAFSFLLPLGACSRGADAPKDAGAKPPERLRWVDPHNTLTEVGGRLEVPMPAARRIAFVSTTPCASALAEPSIVSQLEVEAPPHADFYLKFWHTRGTRGHLCAVALDGAQQLVGLATGPELHFGEDQLVREGLVLTLAPVPPGTRAPQRLIETPH